MNNKRKKKKKRKTLCSVSISQSTFEEHREIWIENIQHIYFWMLEEVNPFASGSEENILIPVWEK
jgi:hypothetical protein